MASSRLHEMFSTIPLGVDNLQEVFFSTIPLVVDGISMVLCAWDSFYSCQFLILSSGVVNRTLCQICGDFDGSSKVGPSLPFTLK